MPRGDGPFFIAIREPDALSGRRGSFFKQEVFALKRWGKRNYAKATLALCIVIAIVLCLAGCTAENKNFLDPDIKTPETEVKKPGGIGNFFDDILDSAFPTVPISNEPSISGAPNVTAPTEETAALTGELRVDFVDVGQADFIVVECDGHYMTIDGGNKADSQLVYSYLEQRGISHIDYVIATHAHEDHCGGIAAILTHSTAGAVFSPVTEYNSKAFQDFAGKAEEQGLSLVAPAAGNSFWLGSAFVEVLGPLKEYSDPNNTSIVLKITYGETSFLFTGDAEAQAEKDILDAGFDVSATVLKVGHHGSSTSTCYQFLREVMPSYAVISCNREDAPEYDHPHSVTLSRLRDADATVYRTDLQGTITCWSDGTTVRFETEKGADANTLYELDKEQW